MKGSQEPAEHCRLEESARDASITLNVHAGGKFE